MDRETGLGARLRQAREWAGFSQEEAAEVTGIAREVISYWENERRTPGLAHLTRLAECYGTSVAFLLGQEPPSTSSNDHALFYRGIKADAPRTRAAVQRWLAFLDEWADILEESGERLPGRRIVYPPGASPQPLTDSRRGPYWATQVRDYYDLGFDAIPDLVAFLDEHGILVYHVALDRIEAGGVSGIFYHHPQLGPCILVNTNTTRGRQTFTLAHELAHALFHYQETGLVSRAGDLDRKERFADTFAAHFLVPLQSLRALIERDYAGRIDSPYDVIRLQRYFRVSYAMMLIRLYSEGFLSSADFEAYKGLSPTHLAAQLGLDLKDDTPTVAEGIRLSSYPPSVLERARYFIQDGQLTPAAAASLLRVSQETILRELLATPQPADEGELRAFEELPRRLQQGSRKHR